MDPELWEGVHNARGLGGKEGALGTTQHGRVVRSDDPNRLTAAGWDAVRSYGIHTIVSLHTANLAPGDESANVRVSVPSSAGEIDVVAVAIEDAADADFAAAWIDTNVLGTPLYYRDALVRWPERHAHAQGPVLIHCGRGHDRTGIIALLLLANAGVSPDAIADDYLRSTERLESVTPGTTEYLHGAVASRGTTVRAVIHDVVEHLDDDFWGTGAVDDETRETLRGRLLAP